MNEVPILSNPAGHSLAAQGEQPEDGHQLVHVGWVIKVFRDFDQVATKVFAYQQISIIKTSTSLSI